MRKLLILYVSLLFVGCDREMREEINNKELIETNFVLTEDEAIATLNEFINSMSETRSLSSVEIIGCAKKNPSDFGSNKDFITRASADNIHVNSVPVYEITTNSNEGYGFGLVLGDKRFNEVIAFTPYGSLSDTIFNEGLAYFAASIPLLIYETLKAEKEQTLVDATRSDYWQPENLGAYITDYDSKTIEWFSSYGEAHAAYPEYFGAWDAYDTPVRYVPVKWHQEAPYNNKVPTLCDGKMAKVGCGAIALAQVMAYHQHPSSYNWSLITSSQQIGTNQTSAANEVSRLMINIANSMNTYFYCKNDGLGGSAGSTDISMIVPGFAALGYTSELLFTHREKVSSQMIRDGIVKYGPVLVGAAKHTLNGVVGAGHVWIIDGFYKKSRNYRLITYGWDWSNGEPPTEYAYVSKYRQHFITLHCNWGWGGSSDGWYFNFTPVNEKYQFEEYHLWTVTPNN